MSFSEVAATGGVPGVDGSGRTNSLVVLPLQVRQHERLGRVARLETAGHRERLRGILALPAWAGSGAASAPRHRRPTGQQRTFRQIPSSFWISSLDIERQRGPCASVSSSGRARKLVCRAPSAVNSAGHEPAAPGSAADRRKSGQTWAVSSRALRPRPACGRVLIGYAAGVVCLLCHCRFHIHLMRTSTFRDGLQSKSSAKVAELADAPDLGSGSRKALGVRLPPFAFDSPSARRWRAEGSLMPGPAERASRRASVGWPYTTS